MLCQLPRTATVWWRVTSLVVQLIPSIPPWGVSRSQGYRLLKKAWAQIKDDIDESGIDRQELLSWSIQTLMAAAGQAMEQGNPGAVVACIRQLDHMTGTGYNSHRGLGIRR